LALNVKKCDGDQAPPRAIDPSTLRFTPSQNGFWIETINAAAACPAPKTVNAARDALAHAQPKATALESSL